MKLERCLTRADESEKDFMDAYKLKQVKKELNLVWNCRLGDNKT